MPTIIMSPEKWKQKTKMGATHPRSKALKQLDRALDEYYHHGRDWRTLLDLESRLAAWKATKTDWKQTGRNKYGAVADLTTQILKVIADPWELGDSLGPPKSGAANLSSEEEALAFIAESRRDAINTLFAGTKVKFKTAGKASAVNDIRSQAKAVKDKSVALHNAARGTSEAAGQASSSGGSGLGADLSSIPTPRLPSTGLLGKDILESIGRTIWQDELLFAEVMRELGEQLFGELAAALQDAASAVTPYVGVVSSGGKAVKEFVMAGYRYHQKKSTTKHAFAFGAEGPQQALEGVKAILDREKNRHLVRGTVRAAAFGTKLTGVFVDLGTATTAAIGVAEAVANLGQVFYLIKRDDDDRRRANACLASYEEDGLDVGPEIFEAAPILGCYFLTCATTSDIISWLEFEFGEIGFVGDVEQLVADHIQPVLAVANQNIAKSRLEVQGLAATQGTINWNPTIKDRLIGKAVKKAKTLRDPGPDLEAQARLRSRIVGIGSSDVIV